MNSGVIGLYLQLPSEEDSYGGDEGGGGQGEDT